MIFRAYEDLLFDVYYNGVDRGDRTGTGTRGVFGRQIRFDLAQGFPLVTTKQVHLKSIIHELLWFLKGETNIAYLKEHNVRIWDEWADENGDLGPVYGSQWRSWPTYTHIDGSEYEPGLPIDQIANVIEGIRKNPEGRRHIVTAWNPAEIEDMALPPCHLLFQFFVANGKLSCQLYQRSSDMFLGVPFNIASYSLLTMMVAQQTGLEYGEFVWTSGDTHIYSNHFDQVREQLSRSPRHAPEMHINKASSIFDYQYDDFVLEGYDPHPAIKGKVAV